MGKRHKEDSEDLQSSDKSWQKGKLVSLEVVSQGSPPNII